MAKYIPPHLRDKQQKEPVLQLEAELQTKLSLQPSDAAAKTTAQDQSRLESELDGILNLPCHPRCRAWMKEDESVCGHHAFLRWSSTRALARFYLQHSAGSFIKWMRTKRLPGNGNANINACFAKRTTDIKGQDSASGTRTSSVQARVGDLFNRFLSYAADIDNGLSYVEDARQLADAGEFSFLDIGFAPGGMTSLLLDVHPNCKGIGVNLDPSLGGNVYPAEIESPHRFQVLNSDVIELARDPALDFLAKFPSLGIQKFDLVIVGITTSGSSQKQEMVQGGVDELELKNLLHFSQLLLAFRFLKPGGRILMRMHLGLRIVDVHILCLLLQSFDGPARMTKPLTEFAMRKTCWLFTSGFRPDEDAVSRLTSLVQPDQPAPYASIAPASEQLHNPILMRESQDELLEKFGLEMVRLLEPLWQTQFRVLDAIMNGLNEKVCFHCRKPRSARPCNRCAKTVPQPILRAVGSVKSRIQQSRVDYM
ncbi:hypothetical protein HDU91_007302 [Kappamyces sp. JEL0680]|nr:hypothetical protein HDU91_007302 [Kappamyces sp. JEL0680]